jgi:glucose/arabinose dehydrogenase
MYARFAGMIVTAAVLMYAFTYLNTFAWNHLFFSEERLYMTLTMTAMMAVVMLSFMLSMLKKRWVNLGIYAGSAVLFAVAFWLIRSQATVQDIAYMKSMIPHHSIAILTSERARISDPRVRELADEIIAAQRREISMMKVLINDIDSHGEMVSKDRAVETLRLGPKVPPPAASAVEVPEGFQAEVVMSNLTYPTSIEFDDTGAMFVAEAGYSYGDSSVKPRILKISRDGTVKVIAQEPVLSGPINDLLWHGGRMYVSHRGKISILEPDGRVRDLVTGLPSEGDHHNNQLTVGPDGKIYFGQGTATNSGVVGPDNFKMGWLKDHPDFHDIPAVNLKLVDRIFESENPLSTTDKIVHTLPFHAFGKAGTEDLTVPGQMKANGTIMRMNSDGSGLEVYAWGLRNPYGIMWSPDGTLYATENGFDVRGSRPIANDKEDIYIIKQGAWYGWPDYAMGLPVTSTRFKPKEKSQPQFLMAAHPPVEQPWMNFPKHSAIAKVDFGKSEAFGRGQMFVAFFGHMSPMTGEAPDEHGGHRVVRIDPATREVETFFGKKHEHGLGSQEGHGGDSSGGQGSGKADHEKTSEQGKSGKDHDSSDSLGESFSAGPRRLLDVRFSPDGNALYIADFGAMAIQAGAVPVPKTGVIWRVVPENAQHKGPPTELSPPE